MLRFASSVLVLLGSSLVSFAAQAETYNFTRIGQDPLIDKLTVCTDGKIYALYTDGNIRVSTTGADGSFRYAHRPVGGMVQNIACAGQTLFYLTTGRELYWFARDRAIRVGNPYAAAEIAGGDDGHDGFPIVYALNDDKALFTNHLTGADHGWTYVGRPHSARKIAAFNYSTVMAINYDGSLWGNRSQGADSAWVRYQVCRADLTQTESFAISDAQQTIYVLQNDGTILRGTKNRLNFCNIRPIPVPIPLPTPIIRP